MLTLFLLYKRICIPTCIDRSSFSLLQDFNLDSTMQYDFIVLESHPHPRNVLSRMSRYKRKQKQFGGRPHNHEYTFYQNKYILTDLLHVILFKITTK